MMLEILALIARILFIVGLVLAGTGIYSVSHAHEHTTSFDTEVCLPEDEHYCVNIDQKALAKACDEKETTQNLLDFALCVVTAEAALHAQMRKDKHEKDKHEKEST